jgi:hypothetical protein
LEQLHDKGQLGNYLLLLAHEVLEHPRGYIDLVDSLENTEESPRFVIMDNGVIETGAALPVIDVVEAANLVEADCIVNPDVLGDFQATQKLVISQSTELRNSGFPLMRIPQGEDLTELIQCVDWMRGYLETPWDSDYWGVPRWVSNELGTRASLVYYIGMRAPRQSIHLLGMSRNFDDDMFCTTMEGVMGIDSANPLVMGYAGIDLGSGRYRHIKRGNFWQITELRDQVIENVEWMHDNVG